MRKQEFRATTLVASNFRAVCRARSEREKYAKLCNVVEEADETIFWLEMIIEAGFILYDDARDVMDEATEILNVISAYKKTISSSINP